MTGFNNLKIFVRASSTFPKYWPPTTIWRFLPELVLLLLNSDRLQQFEDFCQSLFYYQILTAFNNLKILSELVLPNTDSFQQFEDFCLCLFYFYKILTAFNNLKIFVKACSTSTKNWLASTIWRFLSELVLPLLNTDCLQQFEDFCQSLLYFY